MTLGARLEKVLGAEIPEAVAADLETLERLLARWGKAVDLEGFKNREERDRRYFAEALASLVWLPKTGRALDIGSGGGSPALPLAAARRSVAWTLVEANERKAIFLEEALREMRVATAVVVRCRYESYTPERAFDAVTLRGVAVTDALVRKVASELVPAGRLLWFSSEGRLRDARLSGWVCRDGPIELVRGGGFLGVFVPDAG